MVGYGDKRLFLVSLVFQQFTVHGKFSFDGSCIVSEHPKKFPFI